MIRGAQISKKVAMVLLALLVAIGCAGHKCTASSLREVLGCRVGHK